MMFRTRSQDRKGPLVRVRYADEWVGLLVLFAIAIAAAAVIEVGIVRNWLTPSAEVRILLPASGVAGLAVGDDVQILGIHAGTVRRLKINPEGSMYAIAELDPQAEPFIRRDSQAVIKRQFVVAGSSYIEITRGKGEELDWSYAVLKATTEPNPADMITKTIADIRAETLPVLKSAGHMMAQLDATATDLHSGKGSAGQLLVDDRLIKQAEASMEALNAVIDRLKPIEQQVQAVLATTGSSMKNVQSVTADLKTASPQIPGMTKDLAQSAAELPALLTQAQTMSDSLRKLTDQLRGMWILGGSGRTVAPSRRLAPGMVQP